MPRTLKPCGTYAAYQRHLYNRETPCQPCKDAASVIARDLYRRRHPQRPALKSCGTYAAYRRHLLNNEPACRPCRDASAANSRRFRGTQSRFDLKLAQCGTMQGYRKHRKSGETPCQPCKDVVADEVRARWRRRHPEATIKLGDSKTLECGTEAGYKAHGKREEPTCVSCKRAHRADVLAKRSAVVAEKVEKPASVSKAIEDVLRGYQTFTSGPKRYSAGDA